MSLVKVTVQRLISPARSARRRCCATPAARADGAAASLPKRSASAGVPVLFSALIAILLCSASAARADVTLSEHQIDPECRKAPTSAWVDGTARTLFVFTVTVEVPEREAITLDSRSLPTSPTYVYMSGGMGSIMMRRIQAVDGRGSGVYRCTVPGTWFHNDDDGLPPNLLSPIWFYGQSISTDPAATTQPRQVRLSGGNLSVTGRGREVLVPVDRNNVSDQFKTPRKAGGITIEPADPANYGDGSASATYTFRVRYTDPEGLPPRPYIAGGRYDELSQNTGPWTDLTTGVEMDQMNTPRRMDDPWRFPTPTDPTLPSGVTPGTFRSGVYIVFDDNNDGRLRVDPEYWRYPDAPRALQNIGDAPRFMIIDTDLQPQFANTPPEAADWRRGVVFKYTVRATDHSVAVGIPRFFEFGSAVYQFLLQPFAAQPGQRYLNAGRTREATQDNPFDPMARSFVSLPAGLRRYTFLTSNDIIWAQTPTYRGSGYNYHQAFGNYPGYETGTVASAYDLVPRYFQQPGLNAPKIDPQSPPELVFFPPFEIRVDPQVTVAQKQLEGDTTLMLIGIPTAVFAVRTNPVTGQPVDVPLYAGDVNRATPSRFTSKDELEWRFYYTQSQGLPPTVSELHLLHEESSGQYRLVGNKPFACVTLKSGSSGRDPLYDRFPDPSHTGAYYAQYGTRINAATNLQPGLYRFFFRVSDGRRLVEWPGDNGGGTSLSTSPLGLNGQTVQGVNHIANTVRINNAPTLTLPAKPADYTVDNATGAISWTLSVRYADEDNDPPSQPLVIFPDPQGDTTKDLRLVMHQEDATATDYRAGVNYILQSATDPTVGVFAGRRQFYFSFTDNWKSIDNPENGETARAPAVGQDLLFLNSQPFLLQARVSPERGSIGTNYTFSVTYGDNEKDPPLETDGVAQVRLLLDGVETDHYLTTDAAAPDYAKGVTYSVTVSGRQIGPGPHTFSIRASDRHATPATESTTTGPSVDTPVLSEASVTSTDMVAGTPPTGYPLSGWVFRVRYKHQSGIEPATSRNGYVRAHVLNPDGTELRRIELSEDDGQTGDVAGTGLTYSNAETPFKFGATGTYHYYFEASDGTTVAQLKNGGVPFQGPIIASAALSPLLVSPQRGVNALPFVFKVTYNHPARIKPLSMKVHITGPVGVAAQDKDLTTTETDVALLSQTGWGYTSQPVWLRDPGAYRYSFNCSDGATTVETAVLEGLTVLAVDPPVLSNQSVSPAPSSDPTKPLVTYRLTYKQSQNLAPKIRLWIGADTAFSTMVLENPADTDYTDGAIFAKTLPRRADTEPQAFYFMVVVPGDENAGEGKLEIRYPEGGGTIPGPNVAPKLEEVPGTPTVSPAAGNTATPFTFTIRCIDRDATTDPAVFAIIGSKRVALKKASGSIQEGAVFTGQSALPQGTLRHGFLADDGKDTGRYPDVGTLPGPSVLLATALNASVAAESITLNGLTPIQIAGALDPVVAEAPLKVTFAPPVGLPIEQEITAQTDGRFSASHVPTSTGQWKVTVTFEPDTAGHGGGTQTIIVTVLAPTLSLGAGVNMIGLPVIPSEANLRGLFAPSNFRIARWVPAAQPPKYVYSEPTTDTKGSLPGQGFWIKSEVAITASALGTLVDHTKPYAVPVSEGWNQVANPFLVPAFWGEARLRIGSIYKTLADAKSAGLAMDHAWTWDAVDGKYVLVHASVPGAARVVNPWQGLWFHSSARQALRPFLSFAAPTSGAAAAAADTGKKRIRTAGEWQVQLVAGNGRQRDTFNYIGVTADSRAADAALESPPPLSGFIDLYLTDPGAGSRYATDYRTASDGEVVWNFVVQTDVVGRPVTVTAPNLSELPRDREIVLEDLDAGGKRTYLRTAGGYTFNPGEGGRRRMRVLVRPRSQSALTIGEVSVTPTRGGSAIGYTLSADALVTVEIAGASGKRLRLVNDRRAATQGRSTVLWDGSRQDGTKLPAGVYFVQITATTPEGQSVRTVRPLVIVR